MQSVEKVEATDEERVFMRAVIKGFVELEEGRGVSLADARLGIG